MNRLEALDLALELSGISLDDVATKFKVCPTRLHSVLSKDGYALAKDMGISNRKATDISKVIAPNKNSKESAVHRLLLDFDLKHCKRCNEVKFLESFYKDSSYCVPCTNNTNQQYYKDNLDKIKAIQKTYRAENVNYLNALSAEKKARKIQAMPKWANLEAIKLIYETCPEGWHVDHVIPLRGKNVCGLHVESNLQHLPALDNMRKSNKFESEC